MMGAGGNTVRLRTVIVATAALLALTGCKGGQGPGHLRLVNAGDKTLQCDIVAGTTSAELRQDKAIARVKLAPQETTDLTPPAGRYTLFPSVWMYQGTKGLAYYPFRLKAGRTLTVTLHGVSRPTFTGSAWALDYKANTAPDH
jgi:hypothetical protein